MKKTIRMMPDSDDNELEIFSEARQLRREERAAFLDQACAASLELRRHLEELLKSADETATFMEIPAVSFPGSGARGSIPSEKSGDRIGHYELIEQIGEDG